MAELYLFDQDDNFITILSKDGGLVDTWFKDYENHLIDEPFIFNVDSNSPLLQYIKEENQAAFYDRDGRLRLVRMKELYEVTTKDGHNIRVKCEPSFLELYDHFIEDKRVNNGTAQTALNRVLEGSRYVGEVTVSLGNATDNFYWIDGIAAVWKVLGTWGGSLIDTIALDDNNNIVERKLWIVQRLGADNGLLVEPDYNAESISRNTLSYPETALYGQGSSLPMEDEEGEHTGGYTRYITFEDVEWSVANGDPVDKPKGQKWVGDPDALMPDGDGYLHDGGTREHRFGHFSNQEYEDPEELLWATWQELQERKLKEVIHEATIYESDKKVSLGDTVTILNREYNKPIELQSQITGLEYDVLYPDDEIKIVVGKYIDMNRDPLQKEVDELKEVVNRPRPERPINNGSYPDITPGTPINVSATGSFQTIQLFWDYDSNVYISHYEVYGSRISDFVPDEQHLLYRGRVSSFNLEVETDEMWYYYIRAVNTRGTEGEFSNRVSASSVRVISADILFGSILAEHLQDNLDLANKLSEGTLDWINEDPLYEIQQSENRILYDVGNRIGDVLNDIEGINDGLGDLIDRTIDVEGSVTNIKQDVNEIDGTLKSTVQQLTNIDGIVSDHTSTFIQHYDLINARITRDEYNSMTGDLINQITEVDIKADGINASVIQVRTDLDGLEIGGRNLVGAFNLKGWGHGSGAIQAFGTTLSYVVKLEKNTDYISARDSTEYNNRFRFYLVNMDTDNPDDLLGYVVNGVSRDSNLEYKFNSGDNNWLVIYITNQKSSEEDGIRDKLPQIRLNRGTIASDWSPAPEDTDNRFGTVETNVSELKINVEGISTTVQKTTEELNDLTGDVDHHSTQISSINQQAGRIEQSVINVEGDLENAWAEMSLIEQTARDLTLSVSKLEDDIEDTQSNILAYINLSTEGIRIHGEKVHISGQTIIDDGVIETAAIANLAVDRFHLNYGIIDNVHIADATIEHGKIKSLNVDHVVAGQMDLVYLKAGEIDTDKFLVRGGSATDYTMIDGSVLESRGRFTRTWRNVTEVHDITTRHANGHIRFGNTSKQRALNISDFGISTYMGGIDEASGTLEFFSYRFHDVYPGLTAYSSSTFGIDADRVHALSKFSATIESVDSGIKLHSHSSQTARHFWLTKSTDFLDGYIVFGANAHRGLRITSSPAGVVQVVDENYSTGGNTTMEAGYGVFNTIRAREGSSYLNLHNENMFRVGFDNNGARVASNVIYRRTYSSAANMHITDEGTLGRSTSARKYKRDIEPITKEYAYNFFDNVTPIFYRPHNTHDKNMNHSHYGYIADDVALVEPRLVQFDNGEPESFNYDRVPSLLHVVLKHEKLRIDKHEDRLDEKDLQIQYLQQKVKQQDKEIKELREMVA